MKSGLIFGAILIAASIASLHAQTRFDFGFLAGVNYSSLRSDLFTTSSGRISPVVGCSFAVGFGDRFELNQEIAFTQKGAQALAVFFRPEQPPAESTYPYFYSTFETALFAGFRPAREFPLWLQGGAFLGSHFSSLGKDPEDLRIGDYKNPNNSLEADMLNDAFSGLDFGPAIGISTGEGHFRASARYYLGVKNLYNNLDFVQSGPYIRTSSVRLALTYFL